MSSNTPLFARQPIFDTHKDVVAYELLFRHSDENYSDFVDGDQASSHVLLNAFGHHNIESIIGGHCAYINFTKNLLINPPPIPQEKIVIEVLEDIKADEQVLLGLHNLRKQGFTIALDDFFINRDTQKMLRYANIVKIDVLTSSEKKIKKYINHLKPLNLTLLAEKIEDYDMLERCLDWGFDLFQGYFLCKPEIIRGTNISANATAVLRLISLINDESASHDDIVDAVSSDAGLSFKIIKLVNSPAIGLSQSIESLSQAIAMLGLDKIKNWANYILMANQGNKPKELSIISLCRAKFCEHLGMQFADKKFGQKCFTVGLLSNLDSFLDSTMSNILSELNLASAIKLALTDYAGEEGEILELAINYERGHWKAIDWQKLNKQKIDSELINGWYLESLSWANTLIQFEKS